MGNQIGAANTASIDIAQINPKLTPVGPLGRRRGRLFASIHARYPDERRDVVLRVLLRTYGDAEQAATIKEQEAVFQAIEQQLRKARPPGNPELRSPAPVHLVHYTATRVTDRAVTLERPYVTHALADRLMQRPFLSPARRLFLVYQLFLAVDELHRVYGISHGDLKHENVLLSASGWLYLADVAPYKPQKVESFDPAAFGYYFDSAESGVCTLAPGRFTDAPRGGAAVSVGIVAASPLEGSTAAAMSPTTSEAPSTQQQVAASIDGRTSTAQIAPTTQQQPASPATAAIAAAQAAGGEGTPKTPPAVPVASSGGVAGAHQIPEEDDVFSAACVAAHIMSDEPLFKLSHVLELRNKSSLEERRAFVYDVLNGYPRIAGPLRDLIVDALVGVNEPQASPSASPASFSQNNAGCAVAATRLRATALTQRYVHTVFPRYFPMMHENVMPSLLALPPDLVIHFLWTRIYDIVDAAVRCEWDEKFATGMSLTATEHRESVLQAQRANRGAAARHHQHHSQHQQPHSHAGDGAAAAADGDDSGEQGGLFDDPNARYVSAERRLAIQEEVLDLVAPVLMNAIRFVLTEDALIKALAAVERVAMLCSEDCRRDQLLPTVVSIVQSTRAAVTGPVRAAALHALATTASAIRALPPAECFLFEEYIVPAVAAAAKHTSAQRSPLVACALAQCVAAVLRAALLVLEQRQALGKAYRSRLSYDSQRELLVHRCWDVFKPLLIHPNSSVVIAALRQTELLLPSLGLEIASDEFVSLLSALLGSPVVEVKREMYRAVLAVALFLKAPVATSADTIFLMLEDSLREKDARCIAAGLDGLRRILECGAYASVDRIKLVQAATGLLAHPSAWVHAAAAKLFATAARVLDPVDVLVRIAPAVRSVLREPVPIAMLDKIEILQAITPGALMMHANDRRRLQCCVDYLRQHPNQANRVLVPPSCTPVGLLAVPRLETLDLTVKEVDWLVRSMGLDGAAAQAAHGRGEVAVPFLARAPDLPWHMSTFAPTPRQLKRALWVFKLYRRSVAASAKAKLRRGLNLREAAAPSAGAGGATKGANLSAVVAAAASKARHSPRPMGVPCALAATAHDGGVTAIATARHWVLSAGRDSVLRLWDASDVLKPGGSPLLMAQPFKDVFGSGSSGDGSAVLFAHFARDDPQSRVVVGDSLGRMRIFDIMGGGGHGGVGATKVTLDHGQAGGLSGCVSLDPNVLVVGSHRGGVFAVDMRVPSHEVWQSAIPRSRGPISSVITVSPDAPFGIACGTLRGYIALFDMRFRSQMASTTVGHNCPIYDMAPVTGGGDSTVPSIAVAAAGSDVLRLSAQTFQETLALRTATGNSVSCLVASHDGQHLFSGGADGLLRHWNLAQPESSRTLFPSPPARPTEYNFNRGAMVVAETMATATNIHGTSAATAAALAGPSSASGAAAALQTNHQDRILKLACVTGAGGKQSLVSGSRDGALAIWRNIGPTSVQNPAAAGQQGNH